MPDETFLRGKVTRRSLPMVLPSDSGERPILKRLMLGQGELAQIYDSAEGARYLAAIELREGSVRGNHFHKVKEEFFYIVSGEVRMTLEDTESQERVELRLSAGDLVSISTGVAHAIQVVKAGLGIEFSPARFDPADIHKKKLL